MWRDEREYSMIIWFQLNILTFQLKIKWLRYQLKILTFQFLMWRDERKYLYIDDVFNISKDEYKGNERIKKNIITSKIKIKKKIIRFEKQEF